MFVQRLLAPCHRTGCGELLQRPEIAGVALAAEEVRNFTGTGHRDGKPYSKVHKEVGHGRYIT